VVNQLGVLGISIASPKKRLALPHFTHRAERQIRIKPANFRTRQKLTVSVWL
jgi:hypothetical protein